MDIITLSLLQGGSGGGGGGVTGRECTQAAYKLKSQQVRTVLTAQLVRPVLANGWSISSFRMHWNKASPSAIHGIWAQIVEARAELDQLVRRVPGLLFFVSAINATNATLPDGQRRVNPGLYYWVVSKETVDCRELALHMESNSVGAYLKIQLQPFQTTEKDISGSLCNAVKDNMSGCVRRLVEEAQAEEAQAEGSSKEAIVKFYVGKDGPSDMLPSVLSSLEKVRFHAELYEI